MRRRAALLALLAACSPASFVVAAAPAKAYDTLDMLLLSEPLQAPEDYDDAGGGGSEGAGGGSRGGVGSSAEPRGGGSSAQAAQVRNRLLGEAEAARREASRQRGLALSARTRTPSANGTGAEQARRDRQAASDASYARGRAEFAAQSAENMARNMAILAYQPPSTANVDAVLERFRAEASKRKAFIDAMERYRARRSFRDAYMAGRWADAVELSKAIKLISLYERLLAARASRRAADEGGLARAAVADSMRRYLEAPALPFPASELWLDEHLAWYRAAGKALADPERDAWRGAVKDRLLVTLAELYMTAPLSRSSQLAEAAADLAHEGGTTRKLIDSKLAELSSVAPLGEGAGRWADYNGADIPYLLAAAGYAREGERAAELELWRDYRDYARFSSDHYRLAYLYEKAQAREAALAAALGGRAPAHSVDLLGVSQKDKAGKKEKAEKQETKKKEGMDFDP